MTDPAQLVSLQREIGTLRKGLDSGKRAHELAESRLTEFAKLLGESDQRVASLERSRTVFRTLHIKKIPDVGYGREIVKFDEHFSTPYLGLYADAAVMSFKFGPAGAKAFECRALVVEASCETGTVTVAYTCCSENQAGGLVPGLEMYVLLLARITEK